MVRVFTCPSHDGFLSLARSLSFYCLSLFHLTFPFPMTNQSLLRHSKGLSLCSILHLTCYHAHLCSSSSPSLLILLSKSSALCPVRCQFYLHRSFLISYGFFLDMGRVFRIPMSTALILGLTSIVVPILIFPVLLSKAVEVATNAKAPVTSVACVVQGLSARNPLSRN